MKNINLLFLLLILVLASCQKNQDFIDKETETTTESSTSMIDSVSWWAIVNDMESVMHYDANTIALHNVSVKLMAKGAIIAETNTSNTGRFEIDAQSVPDDAYFLLEAPGYYNTVVKVKEDFNPGWQVHMARNTYPGITREITSTKESHILLHGKIQEPFHGRELWFYITNDKEELVGTDVRRGDVDGFSITTLPDQELFLHYGLKCFPGDVISLGSFSEDTDLGVLLDQAQDFSIDSEHRVSFRDVSNCVGDELFSNKFYAKINGLTRTDNGNRVILFEDCYVSADPILITGTYPDARKYQEVLVSFSPGSQQVDTDIRICEDDDTFVHYSIGGSETQSDIFTFANILPDGRLVIKQPALKIFEDMSLSFVSPTSNMGNSKGDVLFHFSWDNSHGGNDLDFNITMNDGEFVEGTINGEILDTEEQSMGMFDARFRARIQ